ncbi:hypothetical protein COCSUDRAFT_33883 [Coccomyxa subellipsoidea C-169]|uniref:Uncharacterized protein n=1 Tax=Coccomyxa subellipsoidea (strain C-169) TaxID=574566 RepID=I0YQT9_COCSC|nr:hypothetical protein COCSUDRAFT_33883 [Coccomyxa subellipsoidea C-169]EIE20758.1 hypothetical protein COCSUDRAFT_33883 [Coccomyxa subellipsoidea C-169]|eukprot:XP_005645302.1 hypothetical protein COCSUDRAFT_33883 [Coccomyxa subellipsoidea C-169]
MASWARAAKFCSRVTTLGSGSASQPLREASAANSSSVIRSTQQCRGMASDHGPPVTYAGLTLYKPARWHVLWGEGMASLMWFWIFYRAYHDGSTLLFGHAQHFEHDEGHGESHEGDHEESH